MPDKFEVANLLSVEQAIPADAANRPINESELLVEADRINTDAGQLCGLPNLNRVCHTMFKDKPWS